MSIRTTVAVAVRIEIDPSSGEMFLVFKVIDESFKKTVRDNWDKDVPLQVLGKDLKEI